jgi:ubiquinone/menaquinone biosynthesis C-methylase UbiE
MYSQGNRYSNTASGFDRITFIYDVMTRLLSFNRINKSQLAFLSQLSTQQTCLILGGGTGYFLQKLLEQNKTIHIIYVDASAKMISAAQQRIAKELPEVVQRVTFICNGVEEFVFGKYDIIVCNYFLDVFDEMYADLLIQKFQHALSEEGLLYITDFTVPDKKGIIQWCTKAGLKVLYLFFKWVTSLPAKHLPPIESLLFKNNFMLFKSATFFKGVLKCSLYKQI